MVCSAVSDAKGATRRDRPRLKWFTRSYGFCSRVGSDAEKIYKPEEIVAKLRQVDVMTSQGQGVAEAIRAIGVREVTYHRQRQEFGGLKND
jgi:hypothetical protein